MVALNRGQSLTIGLIRRQKIESRGRGVVGRGGAGGGELGVTNNYHLLELATRTPQPD